ncbi:MAG: type IV pilin [Thermoplasmata archaeon]|nr:type IV pilin [Thermoplasmata archaeon]
MKANRKFVNGEEAVSAVIGVILMVAITVAIAATVYVWVTGFGGGGTPAPSMSISQQSAVDSNNVSFSVVSASSDARWTDLKVQVVSTSGSVYTFTINNTGAIKNGSTKVGQINSATSDSFTSSISAGDTFWIDDNSVDAGATLKLVHTPSNSVILTKTLY